MQQRPANGRKARHKGKAKNHLIQRVRRADQQGKAMSGKGPLTAFLPAVHGEFQNP
jgi:hypothetical protein